MYTCVCVLVQYVHVCVVSFCVSMQKLVIDGLCPLPNQRPEMYKLIAATDRILTHMEDWAGKRLLSMRCQMVSCTLLSDCCHTHYHGHHAGRPASA